MAYTAPQQLVKGTAPQQLVAGHEVAEWAVVASGVSPVQHGMGELEDTHSTSTAAWGVSAA